MMKHDFWQIMLRLKEGKNCPKAVRQVKLFSTHTTEELRKQNATQSKHFHTGKIPEKCTAFLNL